MPSSALPLTESQPNSLPLFDAVLRPVVRLFLDRVTEYDDAMRCQERSCPLIQLSFEYGDSLSGPAPTGAPAERSSESTDLRARRTLESFGAVDLQCMDAVAVAPDVPADYLVSYDDDAHAYCGFTQYVVPQLRELGWRVEIDDDYPYKALPDDATWYTDVQKQANWFEIELGVEVNGQRIDMLPHLLELLSDQSRRSDLTRISKGRRTGFALKMGDQGFLSIPADQLRLLMQVLVEFYIQGTGQKPRVKDWESVERFQAALENSMPELGGRVLFEPSPEDVSGVRIKAPPPRVRDLREYGLRATLRPYQEEGLEWLQGLIRSGQGGVLADDMGLGKTLQTIAHITLEKAEGRLRKPALVVGPTSLVGNWKKEIRKFSPGLRTVILHGPKRAENFDKAKKADVVITSYPLLLRDEEFYAETEFHILILDEAHTIKNRRSRVHKAAQGIKSEHRLCLTGTPVENHLGELWSLFDFLNPGLLGDQVSFRRWFRQPIENQGDEDRLAALRQLVAPYVLRRMKSEVAKELPKKTVLQHPITLSGRQRELYESIRIAAHAKVRRVIQQKGIAASTISILDALTKLRQVCCDPRLIRLDAATAVRSSAKHDAFFELVERQLKEGHRILVFSQFTSMLAILKKGLKERKIKLLELTGASKNRQQIVDDFEAHKADVFLISLKAGGCGLTLTSADTVIHYDPWWNPAVQDQATDRAYRIGQNKPVFVFNLFVAGSVEERMLKLQQKKRKLAEGVLSPSAATTSLSHEDVDELFAPLLH